MGLFRRKKNNEEKPDALVWIAFIISVLGWLLKAMENFPILPEKQKGNEGADSSGS